MPGSGSYRAVQSARVYFQPEPKHNSGVCNVAGKNPKRANQRRRSPRRDAIAYAYYGPIGRRSWGGGTRRGFSSGIDRHLYSAWWNDYVILGIQIESVEAVTNIHKLAKPGISVVTFGPNDLSFSLEAHPGFPMQNVDECMRNVAEQLQGTGIRLAMGTATQPEERDKYLEMGFTLFQADMPD